MCRVCLVEVEGPRGRALVPSCTTPVAAGLVVHTASPVAKKAQEGVLEFLLINHPLDCPVCDRGGECPLQDQVLAYGPGESRFVEEKRHFPKPIEISELVLLDRERCILCARCTRFTEEVSGDPLLEFVDRGYGTQVLTFPNQPFRSYFSGNTVQICPVGALTAKPYRFRARPWDLEAVESTCTHCSVGCRISVQTSHNQVLRFLGVDNDATNQGWLCDKGRFLFDAIGSPRRLTVPLVRGSDGTFSEVGWDEALAEAALRLQSIMAKSGGGTVAGLGGARSTNESAYAFGKLLRAAVGTNHLDAQLADGLDPQFTVAALGRGTINDLDRAATILVWGPDLKEELPVLYLRVRRAAQAGATLIVCHPRATGLDDRATHRLRYRPGEGPELLARLKSGEGEAIAARQALGAGSVVALLGRASAGDDPRLPEAVAGWLNQFPDVRVLPLARRSNVYGALDMGLAPTLLPGRVSSANLQARRQLAQHWGSVPEGVGRDATGILSGLADGQLSALLLAGSDPVSDYPDPDLARRALSAANLVIAFDTFLSASARLADVVFPVAGFTEVEGTATNLEGRVQKLNRIIPPPGLARPEWSVFDDLALRLGFELGALSAEVLAKEIAAVAPAYQTADWDVIESEPEGLLLPRSGATQPLHYVPVDPGLKPHKVRLALHRARVLYDQGVHLQHSPSLVGLAPGGFAAFHPDDAARMGIPPEARVRLSSPSGHAELPVRRDPSLAPGTVFVPIGLAGSDLLGSELEVRVEVIG